ncbi:MAG TPA: hypothetical protein VFL55_25505 [Acetobacteraceae bacterium]|nr:hypothetical protein [Acetobacteraceae bacterium]
MRTIRTSKKRKAFLDAIEAGGSIQRACQAAGIARSAAYAWRDDDAGFASDWNDAVEQGTDQLEDAARQRALNGSDLLIIFLLRARRPHLYCPPRPTTAIISLSPEDAAALAQARRIREMSSEEIQQEIDAIDERRRFAEAARAEIAAIPTIKGNGRGH